MQFGKFYYNIDPKFWCFNLERWWAPSFCLVLKDQMRCSSSFSSLLLSPPSHYHVSSSLSLSLSFLQSFGKFINGIKIWWKCRWVWFIRSLCQHNHHLGFSASNWEHIWCKFLLISPINQFCVSFYFWYQFSNSPPTIEFSMKKTNPKSLSYITYKLKKKILKSYYVCICMVFCIPKCLFCSRIWTFKPCRTVFV